MEETLTQFWNTLSAIDRTTLEHLTAKLMFAGRSDKQLREGWAGRIKAASLDLPIEECRALGDVAILLAEAVVARSHRDVADGRDPVDGNSQADLLAETERMQEAQMSFNLQYLQLQSSMQNDNRQFTIVSNIMKTKHDTVKNTISNIH